MKYKHHVNNCQHTVNLCWFLKLADHLKIFLIWDWLTPRMSNLWIWKANHILILISPINSYEQSIRLYYIIFSSFYELTLSSKLYIYLSLSMQEAQAGIKIAGRNINNLRFADDTTLMAESEEEPLDKVKEESEKMDGKC